jgi:hypothetical protein
MCLRGVVAFVVFANLVDDDFWSVYGLGFMVWNVISPSIN